VRLLVAVARWLTCSHTSGGRAPLASPSEGKRVNSPGRILLDRVARAQALACGPAHPQPSHPAWRAMGGAVELEAEMGER
jgi:hypothetical protein